MSIITRIAEVEGRRIKFVGQMTGFGTEDVMLSAYDEKLKELISFHVNFSADDRAAAEGFCCPKIVPLSDPAMLDGISIGGIMIAALAAAFSIADKELADIDSDYQVSLKLP
jgi:hypothetical protein